MQIRPLVAALLLLILLSFAAWAESDRVTVALGAFLGAVAGFGLYHASFGFTSGWRKLLRLRRGAEVRAQMLLIGATALVSYPLIGWETLTGWDMHPVVLPMTLASAIGAFVFGIGMQLGGGCASGTLFTVGGGSTRMVLTLAAFVAGSVAATAHMQEFWLRLDAITGVPNVPGFSIISAFGPLGALSILGTFIAVVWVATLAIERGAHGSVEAVSGGGTVLAGPWSLRLGALVLAGVGIGCFLLFQRPWALPLASRSGVPRCWRRAE